MAALLRGALALVAIAVLVVGVPVLLVKTVGNPFPSELPSADEIRIVLTQAGDGFSAFVVGTLAVIVWALWAQLMVALAVEIVAAIRRSGTPKLPLFPGTQTLAARLVAPILLTTTLLGGSAAAPAIGALTFPTVATVEAATESPVAVDRGSGHAAQLVRADASATSAQLTASMLLDDSVTVPSAEAAALLTVSDDVELWDLAEAAYGDGISWKQIASANAGRTDAHGTLITGETELVPAGTRLLLAEPVDPSVRAHGALAVDDAGDETGEPADPADEPVDGAGEPVASRVETDRLHVVEVGDSMWTIAETEVERRVDRTPSTAEVGEYWTDVVAANRGVPSGDVDLIHPGDTIVLPGASAVREPSDDASAPGEALPSEVPAGEPAPDAALPTDSADSTDSIDSDREASDGAAGDAVDEDEPIRLAHRAASSAGSSGLVGVVDGPVGNGSSHAHDSSGDATPDTLRDTIVTDEFPVAEMSDVGTGSATAGPAEDAGTADHTGRVSVPAVGMAAMGAMILSAGVVGALRRRRDRQRRSRPEGTIARSVSSAAAAFEAAMVHSADRLVESRTGLGWRMLPASVVGTLRAAGPLEVRLGGDGRVAIVPIVDGEDGTHAHRIELGDDPGPQGAARAEAAVQEVIDANPADFGPESAPDHAPPVVADPGEAVVPTTIVVGTDPATGEAVLLDLASVGLLELRGRPETVRRFARGVVLDLAVSDRCDDLWVVAVGVAGELEALERVRVADDLADALRRAKRSGHAGDSATPIVIVVCETLPDADSGANTVPIDEGGADAPGESAGEILDALRELGAMVVAPGLGSRAGANAIELVGETATIMPAGSVVSIAAHDDGDYRSVAELVDTSKADSIEAVDEPVEQVLDIAASPACTVEPGPIEVQVLGPVVVAGADSFSSLKAVDVIAYLAFHRHGVDADQIKTWVWPAFEPPTDKAFANVMSRARTALGTDDEGAPFLSRAGADRTYRLAEAVTTDFDRFRAIVELADEAPNDADRLAHLRQALELIRGVPFTGGAAGNFVWADNHVRARVEYTIDEAVHRCTDLAIELGDLATARWAALKGQELVPGCEQCFRRRFLIAGADKNRRELRRAMADLEASATLDLGEPEAVDIISDDLLDLYHRLDRALVGGAAAG